MREQFERDGFVIVPRALGPELPRLEAAVDRVWAEETGSRGPLHRLAFVGLDDAFLELVDHPASLPVVSEVLGWNVYVYHCHLDIHPPEPRAEARWRWHQDGGRQNVELESPRPRLSVKVAFFLTDVPTAEHGALRVVPGSHRSDTLSREQEPADAVPLLVEAGSAVIFDRRLWHARGDNLSDRTRKALFYGYTYRWIRPRDELTVGPERLARLTPLRRQLLGLADDTADYWFPTDALRSRMPLYSSEVSITLSQSG
ncbi:MAG TPA: phytanoyl-CoA dioxygenase family protein [Gaiellaceae bacterium]|nr:phytanoyl-CoA dioxygenase family protein [Gaiellaceae bacterium]